VWLQAGHNQGLRETKIGGALKLTCSLETGPNLVSNSQLGLAGSGQGNRLMKTSRFSEQQISFILKQAEDGTTVEEVCRKAGISIQTYYRWRSKYGGLMPSEMKRLKQLEEENVRLKWLVANLSLDKEMLQDVIRRKM
jgi:putative transposase